MNNFRVESIVDSTVWVDFFRGQDENVKKLIFPLIEEDKIFYNSIIVSELLIGTQTEKEYEFLMQNFDGFNYLETSQEFFKKVAQKGNFLKAKGITIPLTDLIIAVHSVERRLKLITKDRHFELIYPFLKKAGFDLMMLQ